MSWTKGDITHGIFLDVKSAFDKVWHKGLLAKLEQINIGGQLLNLFQSYLCNRHQVVVVDGKISTKKEVKAGIPQGSRLGPLLFIIYINDITENIESDILIFADDTSLLATGKNTKITAAIINRDLNRITEWAKKWKVNFNADKSEEIIFSNVSLPNRVPILLNGEQVKRVNVHKHLGIYLSYNLDWSLHIHHICMKANRKLAVIRSVKMLKRQTLDVLYKLQVRSLLDYSLPVFYNSLSAKQKVRLDKIQYTAAKIVTGALHFTSKEKLYDELGWETIQSRTEFLGLSLFHKIVKNQTRPLIRDCLPPRSVNHETLRSGGLINFPYKGLKFANSFFPFFTKRYNLLSAETKKLPLDEFKTTLSKKIKPTKFKHYNFGQKYPNILLTQIRVNCSYLHAHSYSTGHSITTECSFCNSKNENSLHFIIKCPHFAVHRQALFDLMEQKYIPNFKKLSMKRQFEILVFGYEPQNPEMKRINGSILMNTQNYILKTKRFHQNF